MTEDIRWTRTHCARMDHGGCALLVGVKDNRIVRVKGDPEGYLNRGYTCPKGLASPDRLTHPDRLRYPLRRVGDRGKGDWERISWDEAIGTISEHLQQARTDHGARSVAFCQGMPKGLEHFVLIRLANLFGSPNVVAMQDVCHAPREVTGAHTCGFYPVVDFHRESRLVMAWGSNVTATNEEGEINSLLLEQTKQGTELIVVDPRKTRLAEQARHWLQPRPGTDAALALAFLNVVIEEDLCDRDFVSNWTHGFEELARHVSDYTPEKMSDVTRVDPEDIRQAARRYAKSRPGAIQWGNPIEHHVSAFDTIRSLICLMAVCGNLDVPGGNVHASEPPVMGLAEFVRADLIPSKRKEMIHAYHGTLPRLMTVPPAFFRKAVLEGEPYPVRAAYMQCTNPLLTYADSRRTFEALTQLDFLAVTDVFMTPTAALADVVLPAATHFEFNDIGHYGLGHGYILARPKVVDPPESCRPDMAILNDLGKAMTGPEHWYDTHENFLEAVLEPSGLSFQQFAEQGVLKGKERYQKYRTRGFKTPTGKVELMLSQARKLDVAPLPGLNRLPGPDDPDYPLTLTSAKNPYYLHSSYRWLERLRRKSPEPVVEIHPQTAERYGLGEGDPAIIETRSGAIRQAVRFNPGLSRDVLCAAYGWWFPESGAGEQYEWQRSNYNMLTTVDVLGREFGTPNLRGMGCRIRKKE